MEIIPAIDLRGGRTVRLFQGDFSRETVYSDDPVAVAQRWISLGAPRLHVVDLDGAAAGEPQQVPLIHRIVEAVPCPVQVGGGLRTLDAIQEVFGLGVQRAVLGTVALEDFSLVEEVCRRFGEAIIVAVDARQGLVATHGWTQQTHVPVQQLVEEMAALGVRRFLYTDIARDGTLEGPNVGALERLVKAARGRLLVSGGIASLEDLHQLAGLGVEGAIIGKALYTGDIKLDEALEALRASKS